MSKLVDVEGIIEGRLDGKEVAIRGWLYNKRTAKRNFNENH